MSKKLILPPGNKGTFLLTPKISREMKTHVKDMDKLVKARAEELDEDLYIKIELDERGVLVHWGPESDLDLSEYVEVTEDE